MVEPEGGSRSLSSRVGAGVETAGVLPVPDDQRTMRAFRVFVVWLMAASSATTPLVVARKAYGWHGAFGFTALFTVVNLGWFRLNTAVGAVILAAITNSSLLMIVCYGTLFGYLAFRYQLIAPAQTKPMNWGSALTIILSFSTLSWTYKLSTASRFAVPAARTGGQRPSYFRAPTAGVVIALIGMGVVGLYSQAATGQWNVAVRRPHRWEQPVVVGVFGVVLAVAGILENAEAFLEGPDFLPRFCYEIAPLPVVAGLVSAALFVVMALPRIRAGAADTAESVVVGE